VDQITTPVVDATVAVETMLIRLAGGGGAGPRGMEIGSSSARMAPSGAHNSVRVSQTGAPLDTARGEAAAGKKTPSNLSFLDLAPNR
jgi:hypothetical protein